MKIHSLKLNTISTAILWAISIFFLISQPVFSQEEEPGPGPDGSTIPVPQAMSFTGAATQSVPIVVPPGRNGIGPNLSLNYNSYQKNGWVGVGWSLGMGAIQRSTKRGVCYDPEDPRYDEYVATINGSTSELVKIDDDGNYRAKIEGAFTKYHLENNIWTVTTKDGTFYTYGGSSASRQYDPNDSSHTFKWCLNKVEDPNGNYMDVFYDKSYGDGEIYLSEIKYTGNLNTSAAAKNRVEFILEGRLDTPDRYTSKFRVVTTRRLSAINIYAPDENGSEEFVRSYGLDYELSPTNKRSRLKTLTQIGKDGGSLPSVGFTYQDGEKSFAAARSNNESVLGGGNYSTLPERVYAADINGDGKTDLVRGPSGGNYFVILINKGADLYDVTEASDMTVVDAFDTSGWAVANSGDYSDTPEKVNIIDITGDGKADFVFGPDDDGLFYYCEYNGSDYSSTICLNPGNGLNMDSGNGISYDGDRIFPVDINGDGKMDIVAGPYPIYIYGGYFNLVKTYYTVLLSVENNSNGNIYFEQEQFVLPETCPDDYPICGDGTGSAFDDNEIRTMDVNGDGYTDLFFGPNENGKFVVWESDGVNSFITNSSYTESLNAQTDFFDNFSGNAARFKPGDVNGDGLQDIVYLYTDNQIGVILNTGEEFVNNGFWHQYSSYNLWSLHDHSYRVQMMDANGDGMDDVVIHRGDHFYVLRSTGSFDSGFVWQSSQDNNLWWLYNSAVSSFDNSDSAMKYQVRTIEYNGDGQKDIVLGPDGSNNIFLMQTGGGRPEMPDLLKKVENGYGAYTEIEYTPSTLYPGTDHTKLPFPVQTASSITINDGIDSSYKTNYTFLDPDFDYENRDFLGFASASRTNPDSSKVVTTFHQDEYRKGRVIRENLYDKNGTEFGNTQYTWDASEQIYGDSYFVKLAAKATEFDNDNVSTNETYDYSSIHGGLKFTIVSGNNAESVKTVNVWVQPDTSRWMWRLEEERLEDSSEDWYRKTWYGYDDDNGNLVEKRYYLDDSTYESETFLYDGYGNATGGLTPRGTTKPTVVYDSITDTYPETVTNALFHTVTTYYDYGFGKVDREEDVNGNWTHYDYDEFGRVTGVYTTEGSENGTVVAEASTDYDDDASPRYVVTSVTEEAGSTIDSYTFYDGLGRARVTATKGEAGQVIASTKYYDNMSRNYRTDGPYFADSSVTFPLDESDYNSSLLFPLSGDYTHPWVKTEYDARGRPVKVKSPDQSGGSSRINTVTYSYNGLETTVTDPDGGSKTEVSDFLGRVIEVVEHADTGDQHTYYEYNVAGDLKKVTDALGNTTHNTYDKLGRKETMSDPDMGDWSYTYDGNGNLKTQTDANEQVIEFTYDLLDRVKLKHYADNTTDKDVFYEYDNESISNGISRLYSVSKKDSEPEIPVAETVYNEYDAMGQVLSVTKSIKNNSGALDSYTTEYVYDMAGKTTLIVYPDAYEVEYSYYDGTGLLHQVFLPDGQGVLEEHAEFTAYEPSGKIGNIYYYSGAQTDYNYDAASGHLLSITTYDIGMEEIQDKSYVYSRAGDITSITDAKPDMNVTHTYTYDSLHRLTGETSDAAVNEFVGNLIFPVYPEQQGQGVPVHAPELVNAAGGAYIYGYDANGNMLTGWDFSDPANPKTRDFEYNADNMPISIEHESKGTTDYYYDGEGQRVKKVVNGNSTLYYVGDHYEVKDGAATKYIFAGNIRLAMVNSSGTYYYHKDHLGSTAAMTMANTSAVQTGSEADYLPFGGERTSDTVSLTNYAFTDQERDAESGLYNYGARLYDPVIGQFITPDSIVPDPYDPQLLNRYSYCRNNPLIYVDPSGHNPFIIGAIIGALAAGAQSDWDAEAMIVGAVIGGVSGGTFSGVEGVTSSALSSVVQSSTTSGIISGAAGGAAAGAVAGGLSAAYYGGDVGNGMLRGALGGALGGAAFSAIGAHYGNTWDMGRVVAQGVTGGILSEIQGGKFCDGFYVSTGVALYGYGQYKHYNRNINNEQVSYEKASKDWTKLTDKESIYHRMGPGNENNIKFISKDGHSEAVFKPSGALVTDPVNMGSYNFSSPRFLFGIVHVALDVIPYYAWGNLPNDPTNFIERTTASYTGR